MKKAISLVLLCVLILLLSLCCGCGHMIKESVEVHIRVPDLIIDCIAYPECKDTKQFIQTAWDEFAAQYKKYKVSLKGGEVGRFEQTEYTKNIPDKYGTEDAVDLTFGGYFTIGSYIYDGYVVPLDDLITDKVYYDFSGGTWALSKGTNGKVYMLPFYSLQNILCYNEDLLAQCGIEIRRAEKKPDIWTKVKTGAETAVEAEGNAQTGAEAAGNAQAEVEGSAQTGAGAEENTAAEVTTNAEVIIDAGEKVIQGWSLDLWERVLSTLARKLPEGAYPMMMYAKNNQGDTHTMIQLRCKGSDFYDADGLFHLNTPEGIAGLQWIRDNYDRGYYPAGCEDMEITDCQKMFLEGKLAFFVYNSSLTNLYEDMHIGYVNFPGAEEHGVNSDWITGFMAFDNGDARKVEVVKDFLRYIYNSDKLMDYSTGGNPCSKNVVERWHELLPLDYETIENAEYSVDFTMNNPNWPGVREAFFPHIHALLTGEETAEEAAIGIDTDCNAAISNTERRLHE